MSEDQRLIEKDEIEPSSNNGIRKNIWLFLDIITITFFATLCSSVPASFFAREYIKMGGQELGAAIILQSHPLAIAITGWICGKLIPHTGYKTMVLVGVLLEGISQIGFGFCSLIDNLTVYTILVTILRVLSGAGNAAAVTTIYGIAATDFGSQSSFVLGVVESVNGMSYLLGPIVGALLFKINRTMLVPIVASGAVYLLSVSRFAVYYKHNKTKDNFNNAKFVTVLHLLSHVAVTGPLFVLLSNTGIFGYQVVFLTVFAQYISLSVLEASILFGIMSMTHMFGSLIVGKVLSLNPKLASVFMIMGCLAYAINFYCFTQTIVWVAYPGSVLMGFLSSIAVVSVFAYSLEYVRNLKMDLSFEERTSCLAGLWMSMNNLGKLPFATIGGIVIQATSIIQANISMMIFCYALTLITLSFHVYLYMKRNKLDDA